MGYIFIIHYLNPSGHIDFYVLNEVVLVTYDSLYKSLWAYGLLFAEVVFGMGYYYDLLPKSLCVYGLLLPVWPGLHMTYYLNPSGLIDLYVLK